MRNRGLNAAALRTTIRKCRFANPRLPQSVILLSIRNEPKGTNNSDDPTGGNDHITKTHYLKQLTVSKTCNYDWCRTSSPIANMI